MGYVVNLSDFSRELLKFNSFAIFCHMRPDGDTLGSSFALKLGLESLGKKTQLFSADAIPNKFDYLQLKSFYKDKLDGEYDAFVAVDCADEMRLGAFSVDFSKQRNTFNIDHHISNTKYAKYNYVFDNSSNSENVYELLKSLNVEISKDIANALMTGLCTDTGNFSHKNVTETSFLMASNLTKCGADINMIYNETFVKQTKNRAKLFSLVMDKLRYYLDDKLCIGVITKELFAKSGANRDETEGFIDFILSVDTVDVAISVMEVDDKKYKISLRSKNVNVNEIAAIFGGGGHVLASGCMISGYLEDVIDKLVFAVKQRI